MEVGGVAPLVEAVALIAMTIGVFQLARSPLVLQPEEAGP